MSVSERLSSMSRGMVIPRNGNEFMVADFAQFEDRIVCWSAGDEAGLERHRQEVDSYCHTATQIFGRVITKDDKHERLAGKVAKLALNYQGGINANCTMGRAYGVDVADVFDLLWASATPKERNKAEWALEQYYKRALENAVSRETGLAADIIKQRYRAANPAIVAYWRAIEHAAIQAIITGQPQYCGKSIWFIHDIFLYCKLPSGRLMAYPFFKLKKRRRVCDDCAEMIEDLAVEENIDAYLCGECLNKPLVPYIIYKHNKNGQFVWATTYGGKLTENETQAIQRDVLAEALVRLDRQYELAFHAHDEIIIEVQKTASIEGIKYFCDEMAVSPSWAEGLPINVEGWRGDRYDKR